MKKKVLLILASAVLLVNSVFALSYSELETTAKENVKCVVEANVDDDVEYITVEELEGEKFEIYAVTEDYVIVIIDDEIYIVSKD